MTGRGESPPHEHELVVQFAEEVFIDLVIRIQDEAVLKNVKSERSLESLIVFHDTKLTELQELFKIRARVRRAIHGHACARERIPREIPEDRLEYPGRKITRPGRENRSWGKTGGKDGMLAKSTES